MKKPNRAGMWTCPVSAKDVDAGDTLTYSLGGEDSASFGIDSSTGLITVGTGTRLDFEARTDYRVMVIVTDSSYVSRRHHRDHQGP